MRFGDRASTAIDNNRWELACRERLLSDKEIKLSLTPAAKDQLVELGFEPSLGARPLKRAILRELQNPLAETILAGGFTGGTTVQVDAKDGVFTFGKP